MIPDMYEVAPKKLDWNRISIKKDTFQDREDRGSLGETLLTKK